jgi:hypothetical protein
VFDYNGEPCGPLGQANAQPAAGPEVGAQSVPHTNRDDHGSLYPALHRMVEKGWSTGELNVMRLSRRGGRDASGEAAATASRG